MSILSNNGSAARPTLFRNSGGNAGAADDRPKAQFWINVGYPVDVEIDGGTTETRFVSMPMGIPVDTQEELKTNTGNAEWNMLQQARNALVQLLTETGKELKPGEERIVNLQVQLRRVKDESAQPDAKSNPFMLPSKKL